MTGRKYRPGDCIELTPLFPEFFDITKIQVCVKEIYPFCFRDAEGIYHLFSSYLERIIAGEDRTGKYIEVIHGEHYKKIHSAIEEVKKTEKEIKNIQEIIREMRSKREHGIIIESKTIETPPKSIEIYELRSIPVFGKTKIENIEKIEDLGISFYNIFRDFLPLDYIAEFIVKEKDKILFLLDGEYKEMEGLVKEYHEKRRKLREMEKELWAKNQNSKNLLIKNLQQ